MANMSDKRREGITSSVGVLAADRGVASIRLWWSVWRWPAALLAGLVLWLALVTIAGAATPPGRGFQGPPRPQTSPLTGDGTLPGESFHAPASRLIADPALPWRGSLRTGFTPRRP